MGLSPFIWHHKKTIHCVNLTKTRLVKYMFNDCPTEIALHRNSSHYNITRSCSWEYSRMYKSQSSPKWVRCSERPAQFHTQDSMNVTDEDVGNKKKTEETTQRDLTRKHRFCRIAVNLLAWSQLIRQVFSLWHNKWISPILKSCKGTLWESGVGRRTTFSHSPSVPGTRTVVEWNSQVKLHPACKRTDTVSWAVRAAANFSQPLVFILSETARTVIQGFLWMSSQSGEVDKRVCGRRERAASTGVNRTESDG